MVGQTAFLNSDSEIYVVGTYEINNNTIQIRHAFVSSVLTYGTNARYKAIEVGSPHITI